MPPSRTPRDVSVYAYVIILSGNGLFRRSTYWVERLTDAQFYTSKVAADTERRRLSRDRMSGQMHTERVELSYVQR